MVSKDVLQSIPKKTSEQEPVNLAEQLDAALPAAARALLQAVIEAAEQRKIPLYVVGGFVRDLLLQRPSLDFDLVVEGDSIPLARGLARQFGGAVTIYKQFGTATWTIHKVKNRIAEKLAAGDSQALSPENIPDALDLVSARRERYARSGALPQVEHDNIQADTYRRDVTVNTLALRLDGEHYGELIDHWGGLDDLRRGRLRVLHDGSFVDDATRILRVLRFAARFDFNVESHSLELLRAARGHLREISGERLRHELDLILTESRPSAVLRQLQDYGILAAIHPALRFDEEAADRLARQPDGPPPDGWKLEEASRADLAYLLWLYYLSIDEAVSVAGRLRLPRQLQEPLLALIELKPEMSGLVKAPPSQVVARFHHAPVLTLFTLLLLADDPQVRGKLDQYSVEWRHVRPTVNGHDLRRRGLPPGPRYGEILWRLRAAWLDGEVNSKDEEHALLDKLLEQNG